MKKEKIVQVRLPVELADEFAAFCKERGISKSAVLRWMIYGLTRGHFSGKWTDPDRQDPNA